MCQFATVGADEQPAFLVEVADRALDPPTLRAEPGSVLGLATRDHGLDSPLPELSPVAVVVVAVPGPEARRPRARARLPNHVASARASAQGGAPRAPDGAAAGVADGLQRVRRLLDDYCARRHARP